MPHELPPPVDGWQERLASFDPGGIYDQHSVTDPETGEVTIYGLTGAPQEWSLVVWNPETNRYDETPIPCPVTGVLLRAASDDPDWGVRCARCGCGLHVRSGRAHMRTSADVPKCYACKPAITEAM